MTLSQYFVFYSGAMTMLAKATAICSICSNYRKIRTSFPLIYDRVFLLAYDKIWNGKGVVKHGLGVIKYGVTKHGVIKCGVITRGVIKRRVIKRGVIKHGIIK